MQDRYIDNITVMNGRITFKNFSGKEGRFNPPGRRNFCWIIEDPLILEKLINDGWNVRYLPPLDPGDDPTPYLQVTVNFGKVTPKVVLITSRGKTLLSSGEVGVLDWSRIINADFILTPYKWTMNGREGVKAYLKSGYFTIEEDDLEKKYADLDNVPDSAQNLLTEPY